MVSKFMAIKAVTQEIRNGVPTHAGTPSVSAATSRNFSASTTLRHTDMMTGSILTASKLSHYCPRRGKVRRVDASACAECGADHAAADAKSGDGVTMSGTPVDGPSSVRLVERAPGSGWGPASNAALSLFVFVLIFGLVAEFHTGRSGNVSKQVVPSATANVMTDSSAHGAPQLSTATGHQKTLAQKRAALDAPLSRARECSRVKSWDCVRLAASEALAVDGGNTEAQGLLERSIKQSAWQSYASAIPAVTAAPPAHDSPASSLGATLLSGANVDEQRRAIVRFGWAHPGSTR
jgi:hypothetical protein